MPSPSKMNSFDGTHTPSTTPRNTRRRRRMRGAPSTPFHYWTSYNNYNNKHHHHFSSDTGARDEAMFSGGRHVVEQSARKMAAGVWRLRYGIGGFSVRRRPSDRSHFEPGMSRRNMILSRNQCGKEHRPSTKYQLRRSRSAIFGPEQGTRHKHSKSNEADCLATQMKYLEEKVKTMSLVSALQAELVQARLYVHDLEYEVRSSRNRVKYLAMKLKVERTSQQKNEHDVIYALVDDVKGLLSRERKKLQKMDVINCQLKKELAEAKLSAVRSVKKYEDERRTRKLLEQVCKELAMKIGEYKAEVEALRIETMKLREEIEEERSMLQVAEVWREERVQMKLIDAKLALESKYSQLNKLIAVLKTFLSSRSTSLDLSELRKAELIGRAIQAVSIRDMEEFSFDPRGPGDIYSSFEELHRVEVFERETEPWFHYSLSVDISDYHPVSPQNYHDTDRVPKHSSGTEEDTKDHDGHNRSANLGSVEESGSSFITGAVRCEIEQDGTASRVSAITETNGVCSISAGQTKLKKSSCAKLRTSCTSSSGSYKAITNEVNGWLLSGTVSSPGTYLPMGHHGSTDSVNSHVPRGMIGCIEWPRGYEKNTLKAKRVLKAKNLDCKDIIQVNR